MSQSLSKLYVHLIFHVKNNIGLIRSEDETELYAYIGGVVKLSKSIYIDNQKEHHKHQTFKEEYIQFLKEYGIEYNADYLWT